MKHALARPYLFSQAPLVCVRVPRPHDAGLVGEDHGLDPVTQPQLGQQVPDVRFHRCFADYQVGRYLRIGKPAGEPEQDIPLPDGQ